MSADRLTIFINQKFPDEAANALLADSLRGQNVVFSRAITTSNLASSGGDPAIDEADVAFGQPDPAACLNAPKLKFVQLTSAGYDRYDRADLRAAFAARGGALCNSSGVYEEPCAEHLVAMMLGMARQLPAAIEIQRGARGWPDKELRRASRLLVGQTAMLLSFGAIARRVVELLGPYRMNLVAVRRRPSGEEGVRTVTEAELDALLPTADHVLNILPGGAATRGFVSAARFARMKAGAVFYNVGRGQTVDQAALVEALHGGRLAGAYLDVTDPEPLPADHALWRAPNCYITPHTAGGHDSEFERLVRHFLENLARFERGEPLRDRVIERRVEPMTQLEYASAATAREPWGPLFFRPSRRSLLLALLAALTAWWLVARHHPWTLAARVPYAQDDRRYSVDEFTFLDGAGLVTRHGAVRLWDPSNGRIVYEFGNGAANEPAAFTSIFLKGHEELLTFHSGHPRSFAVLHDVRTGREIRRYPIDRGDLLEFTPVGASAVGRRLLARQQYTAVPLADPKQADVIALWDFDRPLSPDGTLKPLGVLGMGGEAVLSPDGRRVAVTQAPDYNTYGLYLGYDRLSVFDFDTRAHLFTRGRKSGLGTVAFSADSARLGWQIKAGAYIVYDATTGAEITGAPALAFEHAESGEWSPGQTWGSWVNLSRSPTTIDVANLVNGRVRQATSRPVGPSFVQSPTARFFPDGLRVFSAGPEFWSLAVYDVPSLKPLAILWDQPNWAQRIAVAPDGRHLAVQTMDNQLSFYRPTGPDCPESAVGTLAFPHVWLLAGLIAALGISLRRDALAAASEITVGVARFSLLLLIVALPRTVHAAVGACTGERFLTPAPVLMLLAILLATGARTYRLLALALLAAALPLELYYLNHLYGAGLMETTAARVFDRTYDVPNLGTFIVLAGGTALIPLGLFALSRRTRGNA